MKLYAYGVYDICVFFYNIVDTKEKYPLKFNITQIIKFSVLMK